MVARHTYVERPFRPRRLPPLAGAITKAIAQPEARSWYPPGVETVRKGSWRGIKPMEELNAVGFARNQRCFRLAYGVKP
jgi:hypothetical protein